MQSSFYIDIVNFTPFEREEIRREIVNQGCAQGFLVKAENQDHGILCVTLEGDRLHTTAYEAAVLCWFNNRPESLLP